MFKGFKGLASRFILTESEIFVPTPHFRLTDPMFNIDFEEFSRQTLPNAGSKGDLQLTGNYRP